jgi:hypothetical protein
VNIGEDSPREDKLPKVTACNFCPFRVKRALLYRLSYQPAKDNHPNSCAASRKIIYGGKPIVFSFAPRRNVFSSARDAR